MRAKWLAFLLSRLFDRTRSRREDVIAETQPSSRAALWRGARHSSRYLKPFLEDAIVLHLAAKTSASTTSAANSMLAISENVACNGCAWKWRPRSVRVRMASLPAEENASSPSYPVRRTGSISPDNLRLRYVSRLPRIRQSRSRLNHARRSSRFPNPRSENDLRTSVRNTRRRRQR